MEVVGANLPPGVLPLASRVVLFWGFCLVFVCSFLRFAFLFWTCFFQKKSYYVFIGSMFFLSYFVWEMFDLMAL